jgi:NADPH-dependent ferric siderophore reductase
MASGPDDASSLTAQTSPYAALSGLAQVVASDRLTPRTQRITVTGDVLQDLASPLGPSRPLRMYFPSPGEDRAAPLTMIGEGAAAGFLSAGAPAPVRAYTFREFDAARREATIEFVLHEGQGIGATWAIEAGPGDFVGLVIPTSLDQEIPEADWYLVFADPTSLPALAGFLEHLQSGAKVRAYIEVVDEAEHQQLDTAADLDVTWIHRGERPAGTTRLLQHAVRELEWPAGRVHVWAAAETKEVAAVRSHIREAHGLDRHNYEIYAYWRRGKSATEIGEEVAKEIAERLAAGDDMETVMTAALESLGMA